MIVKIAEVDPICAMQACMDGYEVVSPYINGINEVPPGCINRDLLAHTDLLVTATGNTNVCDAPMLTALKPGAVVCNIGHFDNEIDTGFMRREWRLGRSQTQRCIRCTRSDDAQDYLSCCRKGVWSTWVTPPAPLPNYGWVLCQPGAGPDGTCLKQKFGRLTRWRKSRYHNNGTGAAQASG